MQKKFALKTIVAGVTLGSALSAHAAIDLFASGNGSLVMFISNSQESAVFDLGYNLDTFLPTLPGLSAPGQKIEWDFKANSVTVSSGVGSGAATSSTTNNAGSWNAAWSDISDTVSGSRFGIFGGDSTGTGAGSRRLVTTSTSSESTIQSTRNSNMVSTGFNNTSASYLNAVSFLGTHPTAANGASVVAADAAQAGLAFHTNGFGAGDNYRTGMPFTASQAVGESVPFYYLAQGTGNATSPAAFSAFAGSFSLDAVNGRLVYATAPIPEPSTYALMGLGLLGVGFIARRRKAA